VDADFKDGLRGFLCRKDFWSALKARESKEAESREQNTNSTRVPLAAAS
jgi:hypothetical protein